MQCLNCPVLYGYMQSDTRRLVLVQFNSLCEDQQLAKGDPLYDQDFRVGRRGLQLAGLCL
jgi:hypothetical protein